MALKLLNKMVYEIYFYMNKKLELSSLLTKNSCSVQFLGITQFQGNLKII